MAEFSDDFASCWNSVGRHLQNQAQGSLHWLKATLIPPFLEHFSFRLGNQLFFVRIEDVEGIVESPGTLNGLLSIAKGCNGHACLMPMKRHGNNWQCVLPDWGLQDVETGKLLNPVGLVTDEPIEMTDWELQDFAVQVIKDTVKSDGFELMTWQSNPDVDPSIWFVGEHGPEWIVVRAVRYPEPEVHLPQNISDIAERCSSLSQRGNFAPVIVANRNDPFDPRAKSNGNFLPLIRGGPLKVSSSGMQKLWAETCTHTSNARN